ncbi:MAG: RluA family pseudouridine synthase [Bacteroidales bacterium]|nr:RluA family pseudouridine synthase [Bacteroidales bacterium]MCB9013159.1 RluA family pseudouridine synthase [Bacteroidales bacterium]
MTDRIIDDEVNEGELYEHYRFVADPGQSLLRIDKFLVNRLENTSRSRIQAASDAGNILVNDLPVRSSYKVKPGDIISIVLPDPPREIELLPENIPINIVYEDDQLIIVNKNPGMVVHPGYGNYTGTLINALMYHLKDNPLFQKGEQRPGLVHRIDKDTSGLLVVAKTELAMNKLALQFFNKTSKRKYTALVWGNMEEDEGTITGNLGRNPKDRKKMHVFPDDSEGKHAVTHYKVLERFDYVNLVECRLETGRTHQIRVHFQYIKHPLFNDPDYGGNQILRGTTFTKYRQFIENCFRILPRQALHARSLGFIHPTTGKEMYFESEIPQDMQTVLEKWRRYVSGRDKQETD